MATSVEPAVPKQEMIQKSYFDVLALCCSSEVALVERILGSIEGVKDVSVIVPSKTVIVVHDSLLVTASDIARALNQARLEANVKMNAGQVSHRNKWPSPYVMASGALLAISLFKFVYHPLQWVAIGAVAVGIWPIFMRAFAAVRNLTLDINILVLIAVAGTLALRDYIEAGVIVFLFTIAEWLQSRASHKATAVMSSLLNIAPQKATIAETGEEVNVEEVQLNTILAVKAGQAIPIDGIVVEGSCEVDEKALTGEAFPVAKQKDSTVLAGTMNLNGYISVKTTALAEDCAVAKMAKLVEEAQRKRPKFQKLIDECAKYYTPAVFLLSAGLAGIPAALRVHNQNYWFHLALVVLVSGCPCGLILSTPVATFCALSKAAATGLLIKGGDYMENLSKIKVVAFDKTGTITRGEFNMKGFQSLSKEISTNKLLYWVTSLESKSSHPIADAVVNYGRSQSVEPKPDMVEDFLIFTGEGVSGKIDGTEIFVGNRKLGHRAGCVTGPETESNVDGRTLGFVYCGGVVIGTFSLFDSCRSGAIDAVNDLKSMGIRTAMLTGDSNAAATHAQTQLRNALDVVHAELLPEDKARIIEEFKKSVGPTAMVGDGINDAPALALADVGISMGVSGSALATETGHVILMSNDISKIPKAIKLAKKTQRKVMENIVFSVAIKAAVLAAAFAGYAIVWVAVLADVLTCLLVILNSMTLLRQKGHGSSSKSHHHGHGHGSCQKGTCHDEEPGSHHHHHHNGHHHHHVHHHGSLRLRKHCHHHHDDVGSLSTRPLIVNSHHHHHHDADHSSVLATHDHHGHEHNKEGSCSTHDHHGHEHNKLGSCSMVNGSAAVKRESEIIECPSGKGSSNTCSKTTMGKADGCSSLSTSTCKIQECSSGSALAGKCCESVDCSDIINDPCDSMDECDECNLSSSMARPSCEKDKCRDLEGQDGCLRGEDCGLSEADKRSTVENGRDCQLICCTADHAEEEIDRSGIIEEARGHCSSRKETVCLNGAGSDGVVSLAPAGNKHSVCCRSFTEECCRIHKHLHANFVAGFGDAS